MARPVDWWLADAGDQQRTTFVKRFSPRHWTIDFPRPMMAALTTPGPATLRADFAFLTQADLAGIIWESADRWSHPLLARGTRRDYRGLVWTFRWRSGGAVMPLDQLNGPVLTIEGRDGSGAAQTWYVRLWNMAEGGPSDARITVDFDALRAGFASGGPLVEVRDIDRMFLSVVPQGFTGQDLPLGAGAAGWVELSEIRCEGRDAAIPAGDAWLPEHGLRMTSGYDDSYHQPPERLVEQWVAMGYRGAVVHYVGMSHFPALRHVGGGRFEVSGALCEPAARWHAAFLEAATAAGLDPVLSLSFELFDANAPAAWAQRTLAGERALTGWEPPSTLLSPCNAEAMEWLRGVAAALAGLMAGAGCPVRFQVGEPWWWVGPDGKPCLYDAATVAQWQAETGSAPPPMSDVAGARTAGERSYLAWAGARLAEATASLVAAAREAAGGGPFRSFLLFYAPQVLDPGKPDLKLANMPAGWAWPAFDVLQLEDYDFVIAGDEAGMAAGRRAASEALGYEAARQQYFSGFVLEPSGREALWPRIAEAAGQARGGGIDEVFVWAWPQIARDGFVMIGFAPEEDHMPAFHDVRFPLALGADAVGGPEFATDVLMLASGHEQRNQRWAQARLRYDAGLGVRSEADLAMLLHFFRARCGQLHGFRFRDPLDHSSAVAGDAPGAFDQLLGVGDGARLSFALVKAYGPEEGAEIRRITLPDPASVRVAVGGVEAPAGWSLEEGGIVRLADPAPIGAEVRAGFLFDVPVRFDTDRLSISLAAVRAGEPVSVPMVEIRA